MDVFMIYKQRVKAKKGGKSVEQYVQSLFPAGVRNNRMGVAELPAKIHLAPLGLPPKDLALLLASSKNNFRNIDIAKLVEHASPKQFGRAAVKTHPFPKSLPSVTPARAPAAAPAPASTPAPTAEAKKVQDEKADAKKAAEAGEVVHPFVAPAEKVLEIVTRLYSRFHTERNPGILAGLTLIIDCVVSLETVLRALFVVQEGEAQVRICTALEQSLTKLEKLLGEFGIDSVEVSDAQRADLDALVADIESTSSGVPLLLEVQPKATPLGEVTLVNGKEESWVCKRHGVKHHDIFISYRVKTDAEMANKLALFLESTQSEEPVTVFLDRYCLNDGEDWEVGFTNGLRHSTIPLLLVSEGGLDGIQTAHTRQDNVLLEYEQAIASGRALPLLMGSGDNQGGYRDFAAWDTSMYPNAEHKSKSSNKAMIRDTMNSLFKLQGLKVNPAAFEDKVPSILNTLKKVKKAEALKLLGHTKELCVQCGLSYAPHDNEAKACKFHARIPKGYNASMPCCAGREGCRTSHHQTKHHIDHPYQRYHYYVRDFKPDNVWCSLVSQWTRKVTNSCSTETLELTVGTSEGRFYYRLAGKVLREYSVTELLEHVATEWKSRGASGTDALLLPELSLLVNARSFKGNVVDHPIWLGSELRLEGKQRWRAEVQWLVQGGTFIGVVLTVQHVNCKLPTTSLVSFRLDLEQEKFELVSILPLMKPLLAASGRPSAPLRLQNQSEGETTFPVMPPGELMVWPQRGDLRLEIKPTGEMKKSYHGFTQAVVIINRLSIPIYVITVAGQLRMETSKDALPCSVGLFCGRDNTPSSMPIHFAPGVPWVGTLSINEPQTPSGASAWNNTQKHSFFAKDSPIRLLVSLEDSDNCVAQIEFRWVNPVQEKPTGEADDILFVTCMDMKALRYLSTAVRNRPMLDSNHRFSYNASSNLWELSLDFFTAAFGWARSAEADPDCKPDAAGVRMLDISLSQSDTHKIHAIIHNRVAVAIKVTLLSGSGTVAKYLALPAGPCLDGLSRLIPKALPLAEDVVVLDADPQPADKTLAEQKFSTDPSESALPHIAFNGLSVRTWDVDRVAQWLTECNLANLDRIFRGQKMNGKALLMMRDELREHGVAGLLPILQGHGLVLGEALQLCSSLSFL